MRPTASNLKSEKAKHLVQNERLLDKKLESALQQRKKTLGNVQWRILTNLIEANEGLSMKDLSQLTHTNDSTLTKVVDKLVNDSLVYRRPHPKDRRKILIISSSKGKALHAKLESDVNQCYEQMFEPLSAVQMKSLQSILQTLNSKNSLTL